MTKQEALDKLKQSRTRLTPQREIIIDAFLDTEGYVTVKDIYQRISRQFPQISLDTVYRNAELLACTGILDKALIGNNIVYEMHKNGHNHVMRCIRCGRTEILDICPLDYCINKIKSFQIIEHYIEIIGYCSDCKDTKGEKT